MTKTYTVNLVQRGISAQTHPVSGKSGKLYGNAVASPKDGGVSFPMSLQDYFQAAHDICGNTAGGQQWVPIFVEEASSAAQPARPKCDRCSRPSVAVWDRYPYCAVHAPNNATWYDESERPAGTTVVPAAESGPAPDVLPRVDERLTPKINEGEVELERETLAPPVMGTAEENATGPREIPPAGFIAGTTGPEVTGPNERAMFSDPGESTGPAASGAVAESGPPAASDGPGPSGPKVSPQTVSVVEAITAGVINAVMPQIEQRFQQITESLHKPAPKKREPAKKPAVNKAPTEFQLLQQKAKDLGMNTFGKNREAIEEWIKEKEAPPKTE